MRDSTSIGVAAQMVVVPLGQTLIVFGKFRAQLGWDVGRLLIVAAAVVIPSGFGLHLADIVFIFSLASAASYAILWMLCFHAVSQQTNDD